MLIQRDGRHVTPLASAAGLARHDPERLDPQQS
jgi:hypothetical protein